MLKPTAYLVGGVLGGAILAAVVFINGGASNEIGGAAILGIVVGKLLGWALGKKNVNKNNET